MENLSYLFAAYTATWIVLFAYIFRMQLREKSLRQKIEELEQLLENDPPNTEA